MNRTDRLYALVEELRARAPRPVRAADMAAYFEVSVRTIERDILALMQAGVPIWSSTGPRGGYSIDPRRTMPPLNLTPDEATAIAVALASNPSIPFARAGQSALRKLVAAMATQDADAAARLAKRVHVSRPVARNQAGPAGRSRVLGTIEEALSAGEVVDIEYRDGDGRLTNRTVEVHGMAESRRRWYLVSWCRTRNEARTFRLDRIVSATPTGDRAQERDLDELDSFLAPIAGPVAELLWPGNRPAASAVDPAKLLKTLDRDHAQWEALLGEVGRERMTIPGATGHWSVKDVVAHVTERQRWLLAQLRSALSAIEPTPDEVYAGRVYPPEYDGQLGNDERNAIVYEVHRDRELDDVLAESRAVFTRLRDWIGSLPAHELDATIASTKADASKPGGGRVLRRASEAQGAHWWDPLWRWVGLWRHYGEHTTPIRAWLDAGSPRMAE